jgi:transcriptional/translational regulatory protein YebC/TACO1
LTDNKNRTAADVRHLFNKDGQLGAPGSVGWMFDHWGVVEAVHPDKTTDIEGAAIEAGAQNVEPIEGSEVPENHIGARFLCDRTALDAVSKWLKAAKWNVQASEMRFVAKNYADLSESARKEVADFLNELDEHDDVHRVFAALR